MKPITIKRVYEPPSARDGARVLVDRLWPRGLKKEDAAIDLWAMDIAPSAKLRRWFGHKEERFDQFAERYREELDRPDAGAQLDALRALASKRKVTLLFAAHDEAHNNAVVLRDVLRDRR
jgi:uncharacterized protein YeaO (DUF488 family)